MLIFFEFVNECGIVVCNIVLFIESIFIISIMENVFKELERVGDNICCDMIIDVYCNVEEDFCR